MDEQVEGIVKLITSNDPAHWELVVEYAKQPYMKDTVIEAIPLAVAKIMTTPIFGEHRRFSKTDNTQSNETRLFVQQKYNESMGQGEYVCHISAPVVNRQGFDIFRFIFDNLPNSNIKSYYSYFLTIPFLDKSLYEIKVSMVLGSWSLLYGSLVLSDGNEHGLHNAYRKLFVRVCQNMHLKFNFYKEAAILGVMTTPFNILPQLPDWVADQLFRNQMPI